MTTTTLTDGQIASIQERLRALIDAEEIKLDELKRFSGGGYGAATWSQFINGKYKGKTAKVAEIAREFLRRRDALEGLAQTRQFETAQRLYKVCHQRNELGVITAPSGCGKTVAGEAYTHNYPDVIYQRCMPRMTDSGILEVLKTDLGLTWNQTTPRHMKVLTIIRALRSHSRMIIIDEANHLDVASLDMLRTIHDDQHCGMVLQGDEKVLTILKSGGKKENLAQLYSRVRRYVALNRPNNEDVRLFCRHKGLPLNGDDEVLRAIHKLIRDAGEYRRLGFILDQIEDMHAMGTIAERKPTLEHIQLAHKALIEREM